MSLSFSTVVFGAHTLLETFAGSLVFYQGKRPGDKAAISDVERLWKRWHAGGLLTVAYVGFLGLTKDSVKGTMADICMMFHSLASLAMCASFVEGSASVKAVTVQNLHLYFALGFGAIRAGYGA